MQVVVLTGASDGIGAEMAYQLACQYKSQISLVLAARQADKLAKVAGRCRQLGANILVQPTDVSNQLACQTLIKNSVQAFGQVDVLINNAGMSAHALFEDVPDLAWYEHLMGINLWGSVWCTHAALPYLKARQGRIVAVSSLAGLVGVPGRTAYSATKFAMTGFFEALRVEVAAQGITITLAYPGVVKTAIRERGFNAQGQALGESLLDERGAMSTEKCAQLILQGMAQRKRDIVMTSKGKLGRWAKLLAPQLVDKMAWAAVRKDARPPAI